MEKHPTAKHVIAFLEGKLEHREERATVVAHFLRGCPDCRETAAGFLARSRELPDRAYDTAFEQVFSTARKQVYRGASRQRATSASHASAPAM